MVKRRKQAETRRAKFERLGQRRINRAITAIRLIGNLSSSNYEWKELDVRVIEDTLLTAVMEMKGKFQIRTHKAPPLQFHFPSETEDQRETSGAKQDA